MQYNDIVNTVTTLFSANAKRPVYIEGPPGGGKTSLCGPIADKLDIPRENIHIFRPSLRDPVDLMGVPAVDREARMTTWNPPSDLARLRSGRHLLNIDELPQAPAMMQNALAGLMLDRFIGDLHISDEVYIIATGNRTKDKAGANRVLSQLGNRVMRLEMDVSPEDWQRWALDNGIDPMIIAFLRFKPDQLFDFDPDRFSNATPRAWEFAAEVPDSLPINLYREALSGVVGEGAANEYIGFKALADELPSIDHIVMDPEKAPVPEKADVRYACVAALSTRVTNDNFKSLVLYVTRLPVDYQVLFMRSAGEVCPEVMTNTAFRDWVFQNHEVFK